MTKGGVLAAALAVVVVARRCRRVVVTGNVKYDARVGAESRVAELIRAAAAGRPVVLAGSTVEGKPRNEEEWVMQAISFDSGRVSRRVAGPGRLMYASCATIFAA